jgi:hypothetical protein
LLSVTKTGRAQINLHRTISQSKKNVPLSDIGGER